MTFDQIKEQLEDEEAGIFSYTLSSINLFDILEGEVIFFIQTEGSVTDEQLSTIQYIIDNTSSIEEAIFPSLEIMFADYLDMSEADLDLDKVWFSQMFIPNSKSSRYVLCFESHYDEHSFQILMEASEIVDKGKEFTF